MLTILVCSKTSHKVSVLMEQDKAYVAFDKMQNELKKCQKQILYLRDNVQLLENSIHIAQNLVKNTP